MRERLGSLALGHVDYGKSALILSSGSVEMNVTAGTVEKGSFEITNSAGLTHVKGIVRSTDSRVRVWDDRFVSGTVRIRFEVDARFEDPDTLIEGFFRIVSSVGEKDLPFCFTVTASDTDLSGGIETLDDLAELARTDDGAAFGLFTSPGFRRVPFMENGNFQVLYSGLMAGGGKRLALEEFLTGTGAKEPVHLAMNTSPRSYILSGMPISDSLTVTRNTWGYVHIEARCDSDILILEKNSYGADDFEGGSLYVRYRVDPRALHAGKNFCRIRLDSDKQSFSVEIQVRNAGTSDSEEITARQAYLNYQDLYLNFRRGGGRERAILGRMQNELGRVKNTPLGDTDLFRMQLAEAYVLQGRTDEARLVTGEAAVRISENRGADPAAYCYYLYVNSLLNPGEAQEKVLADNLLVYSEGMDLPDDIIVQLLLTADPAMNANPSMKLSQMKGWYRLGCRSGFLFMEACSIASAYPELLRVLEPFEQQVLDFGAKHRMISGKLEAKAASMAMHMKNPTRAFVRTLMEICSQRETPEMITAICSLLMQAGCRETEYFGWYRLGVENDVRLTGLYEYFLYSMPDDYREAWPRMVLIYFSYNAVLDTAAGARLYRYVTDHPDRDQEMEARYRIQIERFVREQLLAGAVNADLAALYEEYLTEDVIDDEMAAALPDVVFANSIRCEDSRIRSAVICYEELQGETVVEFRDGLAAAPIYTDRARVLLQDIRGNRYESFPVTVLPLINSGELRRICVERNPSDEMIILNRCSRLRLRAAASASDAAYLQQLLHFTDLHPVYRRKLFTQLTSWYLSHPDEEGADAFLLSADQASLEPKDRGRVVDLMVTRGLLPEAWRVIERFGPSGTDPEKLAELTDHMIAERLMGYDEKVLDMARVCFAAGTADARIFEYLCLHFNSSSAQMYSLWQMSCEAGADTHDLEERLLGQMLFSGQTEHIDELFRAYAAKTSCDEVIVKAFLVVKSWLFVMKEEPVDPEIEQYMASMIDQSELKALPDISLISLTLSMSKKPSALTADGKDLCARMLKKLWNAGYLFGYFGKFAGRVELPEDLADKAIVEYKGQAGRDLEIVWKFPDGTEETAPLPEMIDGLYAAAVPLLYGEEAEYEVRGIGMDDVLSRGKIRGTGALQEGAKTRTALLNRILAGSGTDDEEKLGEDVLDYALTDALVDHWFTPME